MGYFTDSIRRSVFGNPLFVPDNATVASTLYYNLLNNLLLDFILFCIFAIIIGSMVMLFRKRTIMSGDYLIYVSGIFIIYSALSYRYITRTMIGDAHLHNQAMSTYIDTSIANTGTVISSVFKSIFTDCCNTRSNNRSNLTLEEYIQNRNYLNTNKALQGSSAPLEENLNINPAEVKPVSLTPKLGIIELEENGGSVKPKRDKQSLKKPKPEDSTSFIRTEKSKQSLKKPKPEQNENGQNSEKTKPEKNKQSLKKSKPKDNTSFIKTEKSKQNLKKSKPENTPAKLSSKDVDKSEKKINKKKEIGLKETKTKEKNNKESDTKDDENKNKLKKEKHTKNNGFLNDDCELEKNNKKKKTDCNKNAKDPTSKTSVASETDKISVKDNNEKNHYTKWITKTLNDEFSRNKSTANFLIEIRNRSGIIKKRLEEFSSRFDMFYKTSMRMEHDMATINSNPRYLESESRMMVKNANDFLLIADVLNDLNYKDETKESVSELFQGMEGTIANRKYNYMDIRSIIFLWIIRICIGIEIILGMLLIIFVFCELYSVISIKFTILVLLILNTCLGIYMITLAQVIDKRCIIGPESRCPGNAITDTVQSDNNFSIAQKKHYSNISISLNKVEENSKKSTSRLKVYLKNDPIEGFKYRAVILQDLFDKILFSKDSFVKIFDKQSDNDKYFANIEKMNHLIEKLLADFDRIDRLEIINFYTREAIFENFMAVEKDRILQTIHKQLADASLKILREDYSTRREKTCILKQLSGNLGVFLIFGSIVLMILFVL